MEMIKNIITAIGCDLLTRGAQTFCGVIDSLTKKDRKKSGRIQRANALRCKVIKSFRKNTQKEYKNLIFLLVED